MPTTVKELMTSHPRMIGPQSSLRDAAKMMEESDCGSLVVGKQEPEGMITDRDIVIYGLAPGHDPDKTKVQEIMTLGAICCYEDESLEKAADLMSEQDVRRLVVLDRKEKLVGVLSVSDIIKCVDSDLVNDEVMHHLYKYA